MWTNNILRFLFIVILVGCSSVPKQELGSYVTNFYSIRSTTQDIILIVKLVAETEADGSNEGALILEERLNALDARLDALELISRYNDILVALAEGTDPEAVYGNLQTLSYGLNSFGSKHINSIVSSVMPYGEIFSQAVSIIDNSIKAKQFKEAVNAAQKPILSIIDILQLDADDLFEIQIQYLSKRQDPERDKINDLRFDFSELVNSFTADENIDQLILDFNETMILLTVPSDRLPEPVEYLSTGAVEPTSSDINTLKLTINQLQSHIQNYNKIVEQLFALDDIKIQYVNILNITSESFKNLNFAIQNEQYFIPVDLTIDALHLRKAYLRLQEAKQ